MSQVVVFHPYDHTALCCAVLRCDGEVSASHKLGLDFWVNEWMSGLMKSRVERSSICALCVSFLICDTYCIISSFHKTLSCLPLIVLWLVLYIHNSLSFNLGVMFCNLCSSCCLFFSAADDDEVIPLPVSFGWVAHRLLWFVMLYHTHSAARSPSTWMRVSNLKRWRRQMSLSTPQLTTIWNSLIPWNEIMNHFRPVQTNWILEREDNGQRTALERIECEWRRRSYVA